MFGFFKKSVPSDKGCYLSRNSQIKSIIGKESGAIKYLQCRLNLYYNLFVKIFTDIPLIGFTNLTFFQVFCIFVFVFFSALAVYNFFKFIKAFINYLCSTFFCILALEFTTFYLSQIFLI